MIGPTRQCPQGIEIMFFDLDDTIVADGAKLSQRVLDAIALARQCGCMACVSSGRAPHMVPLTLQQPQFMDYLVCSNGAVVADTFGSTMREAMMLKQRALEAMDALEPLHPGWNAFVGDQSYFEWRSMSYMMTGRASALATPTGRKALHTGGLYRIVRKGLRFAKRVIVHRSGEMNQVRRVRPHVASATCDIAKLGCSFPSAAACDRAVDTLGHMGGFEVARMHDTEIEITAEGATKGIAAAWLMDYLGIDPVRAVAFGDSENDLPLASVCGTFVAMDNADEAVKQQADDVCESVYDDGVARWIERAHAEGGMVHDV